MGNFSGKSHSITVITPMTPWNRRHLQLQFRLVSWGLYTKVTDDLVQLSFIHFANWSIIRRKDFPYLGGSQPRDRMKYDYLLFCSNFNGGWDQYIDAFSGVLPIGLNHVWDKSVKFPGAIPEAPFLRYIQFNQYSSDYYYNAIPGASATDVKSALELKQKLHQFAQESSSLTAEQFPFAFQKFLTSVQNNLGQTGEVEWMHKPVTHSSHLSHSSSTTNPGAMSSGQGDPHA